MNGTKWTSMFTFIVRWCYCRKHGVTSHGGAWNWVTHIYVSNGGGVLRSFSFAFYNPFQPFYKLFLCATHTRRYVVSIQLWLTTVSCRVTSSVRRNKTWPCADFRKSGRLKATESGRVTPMCAVHPSFILTLLTMSNTMGFKESSRQQDCCYVPTIFPSKHTLYNAHSVSGWTLPAEPGSEWRTPQLSQTRPSKQVFVN